MRSDLGRLDAAFAEVLQIGRLLAGSGQLGGAVCAMVYDRQKTGSFPMKVFRVAAAVALLTGQSCLPVYAQMPKMNMMQDLPSKTQEEKDAEAERDKAYKESLKKIPDAKVSADPWGAVRSPDAPKASTSPKPKTKTGSVAN
jgi:hypothetical protein